MSNDLSEAIYELQSWLMSINDDSMIETALSILNSIFIQTDHTIHLATSLYTAIDYRPFKIPLYIQIIEYINNEKPEIFPQLKPYFLRNCFSDYEKKKGRLFFLFKCYELKLLNIEDVKYCFTHPNPPDETLEHSFNSLYFFCWFAPEIELEDQPFYEITLNWFLEASRYIRCFPADLQYFSQNIKELKKSNWKKLRKMRENNASHCKMLEVLKDDDIEIFQMLQNEPDFDWEQKIEPSIYDIHWIICESPSLFDYSAYFGSVECFKYIYSNYVEKNKDKYDSSQYFSDDFNVVHYAIAGGNIEIVRFLYSNEFSFHGALNIAVLFHRNEIFDWLLNVLEVDINDSNFGEYGDVINYAVKSFNTYVIDICLDSDNDNDDDDQNEQKKKKKKNNKKFCGLFQFAERNCTVEMIQFLLNRIDFNLLSKFEFDLSIIFYPIVDNKLDFVKFFVSLEPLLINVKSDFELPIWTAAKYGRTDIVDFLSKQPGCNLTCDKKSFYQDPYEESKLPFGITTNVFEFAKSQSKRRLELIKERNPFFIGIG